ncbi:MAG: TPM domain-containing protein [Sphingorhabdus sp.]
MHKFLATILVAIAFTAGLPANAQTFPKLTGRVVDQADLLDPVQEAALASKLETLEKKSQRQFVVATITDLQGYDISDYGYQLGRNWGIGDKQRNDGILLLVAPNDRKVRIEVGYGLEGIMTDALSHRIVQDRILPSFRSGDYPGGISAGVDSVITQLQLPPEEAAKIAASAAQKSKSNSGDGELAMVLFWLFIFFVFILPIILSVARGGKKYRQSGYGGPVIIWGGGNDWGGRSSGSSWGGGGFGGFSGGGGSFGGGGASGGW